MREYSMEFPIVFPPELHFEIHSYLSFADLKSLSCCSKSIRDFVIPTLFYSFSLSEAAATDTRIRHEELYHITSRVFHLTLVTDCARGVNGVCNTFREQLKALNSFPNVISLALKHVSTESALEKADDRHSPSHFPNGSLRNRHLCFGEYFQIMSEKLASSWALYNNLRKMALILEHKELDTGRKCRPLRISQRNYREFLKPWYESGKITGPGLGEPDEHEHEVETEPITGPPLDSTICFPPNLQALTLSIDKAHEDIYYLDNSLVGILASMKSVKGTLRSLDLPVFDLLDAYTRYIGWCPDPDFIVYENVIKLSIPKCIVACLADTFPNVQHIIIRPSAVQPADEDGSDTKEELQRMKHLKTVIVPWSESDVSCWSEEEEEEEEDSGFFRPPNWRKDIVAARYKHLHKVYGPQEGSLKKLMLMRSGLGRWKAVGRSIITTSLIGIVITPSGSGVDEKVKWNYIWESDSENYPDVFALYERKDFCAELLPMVAESYGL
ncbi:hypothetical protein TWF730_008793 [Orbilia blumenaviensis]|uniref:F-box domain-containing protein n=1 Tax=Orbilia blumenaviensis TaxID=1796055 RepID=A0AAV9V5R9_9PEZI